MSVGRRLHHPPETAVCWSIIVNEAFPLWASVPSFTEPTELTSNSVQCAEAPVPSLLWSSLTCLPSQRCEGSPYSSLI